MTDLQQELNSIKNQLIVNYQPEKIILFGSMAKGQADEDSDIDLLVIKETTSSFGDRIREAVRGLKYKVPLDIIVYTPKEIEQLKNNNFFIHEIITEGVLLYEK